ncbi:MAG: DUF1365 domain-containing protein [Shimia sp.]|jgi:hypothetical protein|uniref:DUF1365 domain-containing protein n=1 Tax=Shimia sp. TaxID=1954381 RepID=UPI00405A41DE
MTATAWPDHIRGVTTHARRGAIQNAFRYGVDFVMIDPDSQTGPGLFSRSGKGLMSVTDITVGGPLGDGRGADWARDAFAARGLPADSYDLRFLTQPGFLGHVFNPVSFWLALRDGDLIAVISEVSTPFKDRHSYLSHLPDFAPIGPQDTTHATKRLHVSPFQDVAGDYTFSFAIREDRIAIRIFYQHGPEGVIATLTGPRAPLTNRAIILATARRPFGTIRTVVLIHWQAAKLKLKGALWRQRPLPPTKEIS